MPKWYVAYLPALSAIPYIMFGTCGTALSPQLYIMISAHMFYQGRVSLRFSLVRVIGRTAFLAVGQHLVGGLLEVINGIHD